MLRWSRQAEGWSVVALGHQQQIDNGVGPCRNRSLVRAEFCWYEIGAIESARNELRSPREASKYRWSPKGDPVCVGDERRDQYQGQGIGSQMDQGPMA